MRNSMKLLNHRHLYGMCLSWHSNCDLLMKWWHLICHMSILWPNNEAGEILAAISSYSVIFISKFYIRIFKADKQEYTNREVTDEHILSCLIKISTNRTLLKLWRVSLRSCGLLKAWIFINPPTNESNFFREKVPLLYLYLLTQTRSLISLVALTGSVSIFPPEDAISPLSNVYRVSVVNKHLQVK